MKLNLILIAVLAGTLAGAAGISPVPKARTPAKLRSLTVISAPTTAETIPATVLATDGWESEWKKSITALPVVPVTVTGRFIGEVHLPGSAAEEVNLFEELTYFHSLGYTGILFVWDGRYSPANTALLSLLAGKGLEVLFAYSPPEQVGFALPTIDDLRRTLAECLPLCQGFLPCWRRSSLPHDILDRNAEKYIAILTRLAREAVPLIPVIGEASLEGRTIRLRAGPEAGAILSLNTGWSGIVPGGVAGLLRKKAPGAALMALVVGPAPYWASLLADRTYSVSQVRLTCRRIEDRFLKSGFSATITLVGDGYGERWYGERLLTDSLTHTKWRTVE